MSTKTRLRTVCDHHPWMSTASNTASGSSLGLQPSPTVPRAPPGPHIGMLLYYAQPGAHWHGTAGAPPAWPLWSLVEPCPPRPRGPCHTCSRRPRAQEQQGTSRLAHAALPQLEEMLE